MAEIVALGECLFLVSNPGVIHVDSYISELRKFPKFVANCQLKDCLPAIAPLEVELRLPYDLRSGLISPVAVKQLEAHTTGIRNTLYAEVEQKEMIVLKTGDVSKKLRELPTKVSLNPTQDALLKETIICIECEAYRAAAVSGWNLAYDFIRRWMWDDPPRRSAFNQDLIKKTHKGNPVYPGGLQRYEDFYTVKPTLGERDVLELMKNVGMLTGVYDPLIGYLRERNTYAHANHIMPTANQANSYIDHLVDVITSPPFI